MIKVRPSHQRGHADHGWLKTQHSFSFANYYDPAHMGFRALRVINEDRVVPGAGFPTHPHRDMEIVSYVVEGALEHEDSMGNGSVIRPGEVQRMSAGTGVTHSEYNHSQTEPVRLLQIWIEPSQRGLEPGYEQKAFPEQQRRGTWRLVAAPDGQEGSVRIHQDAYLYTTLLEAGEQVVRDLNPERYFWIQVVDGVVTANGTRLGAGDGAAIRNETALTVVADAVAHLLLFDLA